MVQYKATKQLPQGSPGVWRRNLTISWTVVGGLLFRQAGGQMFLIIQVVTVFLVAVAMSLSLAHALELPGKMRLDKDTYLAVQDIYYPGFTYGGLGEGLGMVATLVLLLLTPSDSAR